MTETQGGSDLGANQTVARQVGEAWRLDGEDKYFASNAGLADLAIVTARPQGAPPGPKGIALFLVPRLDGDGRLNFHVRRLKRKSATRAVPTGEVEFHDSLAYLVGRAELGIYYTMENLTVSRLANAVGAMGLARKAHLEALFRVPEAALAFGQPLVEHPLVRYDLTDLAVRTAGGLALAFHAIRALRPFLESSAALHTRLPLRPLPVAPDQEPHRRAQPTAATQPGHGDCSAAWAFWMNIRWPACTVRPWAGHSGRAPPISRPWTCWKRSRRRAPMRPSWG